MKTNKFRIKRDPFMYWNVHYIAWIPLFVINTDTRQYGETDIMIGFRWRPLRIGIELLIFKIMKINLKYRVPLYGEPNKSVSVCPNCGADLQDFEAYRGTIDYAIGFAEVRDYTGWVAVIECPNCFSNWYFHVEPTDIYGHYAMFLDSIKENTQKHFKL